MAPRPRRRSRWCTGCSPAGRSRLTLEALCTWRDAHGERQRRRRAPAVDADRRRGDVVEGAYRLAGPGFTPGRQLVARRATARGGRPRPARRRGPVARRHASRADLRRRATRWRSAPGPATWTRRRRRPARSSRRRRRRAGAVVARGPAGRRRRARRWRWPPTRSSCATGAPAPDVVAGYPWFGAWSRDTMISYEGLFLATGRADEGRELLRGVRRHAVRGDAGQHRRHRAGRVQHRRRRRCGSCTRSAGTWPRPATPTSPPNCCRRSTRSWPRTSPAPGTASGSTRPTGCSPRAPPGTR